MKQLFNYIILVPAFAVMASCSQKLEEIKPDTQITFDQLNDNNLPLALNGAKLALTSNNAFYLYYSHQDIMSDDVESITLTSWESNNVSPTENTLTFMFRQPYTAIATANMIIKYGIKNSISEKISATVGEAYLIRAYSYMLLSEHFGGVVLVYGDEDPKVRRDRNTLAEVQDQIENDLKEAASLLPDYSDARTGSKQAAQLLLARLYLNQGKNDEAILLAKDVMDPSKSPLQLGSDFPAIFKSMANSKESIYKINETTTPTSDQYGLSYIFGPGKTVGPDYPGSGNNWIDSNLVKSYESNDIRKAYFLRAKGASIVDTVYFLMKFSPETTPSYPVCRLSEAYLIIAEAKARKGAVEVQEYNALRTARHASTVQALDFSSPAEFLDEIEKERRREFVGERLRWQDMRRFGKLDNWLSSLGQPATHALLPIPSHEFLVNPDLEQNEDYSK